MASVLPVLHGFCLLASMAAVPKSLSAAGPVLVLRCVRQPVAGGGLPSRTIRLWPRALPGSMSAYSQASPASQKPRRHPVSDTHHHGEC